MNLLIGISLGDVTGIGPEHDCLSFSRIVDGAQVHGHTANPVQPGCDHRSVELGGPNAHLRAKLQVAAAEHHRLRQREPLVRPVPFVAVLRLPGFELETLREAV